jgi:hypothetical protein
MKVNLRDLIRRYWWVDKDDSYGLVRIETKREGYHYYHRAYIMRPGVHNENNNVIEIVVRDIFVTNHPDTEITIQPVGEGLYRASDSIYVPYTGAYIAKAIEADGLLMHVRSAGAAYYLPVVPEDSAVGYASFEGGGSSGVSRAQAYGMAYLTNGLYPAEWVSALPTVRPVYFFLYYERNSGTRLQVYDRHNLVKPVIDKAFPGCAWAKAISLSDMLYYVNRALGHNFKVRDRNKYFTALVADFYTRAEGGVW